MVLYRNFSTRWLCIVHCGVPVVYPPESLSEPLTCQWDDYVVECLDDLPVVSAVPLRLDGLPEAEEGVVIILDEDECRHANAGGRLDCYVADRATSKEKSLFGGGTGVHVRRLRTFVGDDVFRLSSALELEEITHAG